MDQSIWEYWRCPNSGAILQDFGSDDKIMCGCGRTQPRLRELGYEEGKSPGSNIIHHVKKYLPRATEADYKEWLKKKDLK